MTGRGMKCDDHDVPLERLSTIFVAKKTDITSVKKADLLHLLCAMEGPPT